MRLTAIVAEIIGDATRAALASTTIATMADMSDATVTVEATKDTRHGDFCSNIAMLLGKTAQQNPLDMARAIVAKISLDGYVKSASVAGPGFINITLAARAWTELLQHIERVGADYGDSNIGNGEKINIEFASANPTGPLHIGHVRGAILGDTMAEVMKKTGFQVSKEYYINDAGAQVDVLAQSTLLRYKEALGMDVGAIPEGMYPGEYLVDVGKALAVQFGDSLLDREDCLEVIKDFAISAMMRLIKSSMAELRVSHDQFVSEKSIVCDIDPALKALRERGLLYEGILEKPKGKTAEDWQAREQLLFRSSLFGDSADRPLTKSDGSWTYFAADIAYNFSKVKRGFSKLILVLGRDHIGYAKRLEHAVDAISGGKAKLVTVFYEIVNLMEGAEVVKMSKRSGNFLLADDVTEAVGSDAVRMMMLLRSNEMVLDFDLKKATEATKDNPVFYIQYARARACSVLRRAKDAMADSVPMSYDAGLLSSANERALLIAMATWPDQLESTALKYEPHRLVFYLQNLAKIFHSFWNVGKTDTDFKFVIPERPELTAARLALVQAVVHVISSGLQLLKITPLDEM